MSCSRSWLRRPRVLAGLLCGVGLAALPGLSVGQDTTSNATALLGAGKPHEAESLLRAAIATDPRNADSHSLLGIALAQQGELPAAVAEYRTSLALHPGVPQVVMNLGMSEFKQGHFDEAVVDFKAVAKATPADPRPTILLAMSYFGLHKYSDAVPFLRQASAADPSNLQLHNVLAQSCLWSRQFDCALDEFQRILMADRNAVQAQMLLAQALDATGKTEEAIAELEPVAASSPREPVLHFELGFLYLKKRNYERALPELQLEISNNPGYAQAYVYLGEIAMNTNKDAEAERLLKKALELQGDLRIDLFDLGVIYSRQGRNDEAIAVFERAVSLDPNASDAHYRLARLYLATGQKGKADQEFARTRELHKKDDNFLIDNVTGSPQNAPQ